ncbi:MAG: transaldolase [Chloroflexi bacterium]|nr:transaldolase [Chloroflexota bacterium]
MAAIKVESLSPLQQTAATATDIWNDSCDVDELTYAIEHGAVGATANPTIVHDVWKKDPEKWGRRVRELADELPGAIEADLAWAIVEEMSLPGARLLEHAFESFGGRQGRLSMQTNPTFWRSREQMLDQAIGFAKVARNIIVKFPATQTGVAVMEEATYRGISINCTVSFSVAQAVAAAEAVERGLDRREREGLPTADMGPVITLMVGRIEDWLRVVGERDGIVVHPASLAYSGVAIFKRAYAIFRKRGFRARLLAAAIRHHLHWSEFVGGDVVITLPSAWQKRFNASSVEVRERMDDPVGQEYIDELVARFPDFERAYEPAGLSIDQFDSFPPTVRTLRAFISSYHDLLTAVTDAQLPNPDQRS